jgi:hypothetical protein
VAVGSRFCWVGEGVGVGVTPPDGVASGVGLPVPDGSGVWDGPEGVGSADGVTVGSGVLVTVTVGAGVADSVAVCVGKDVGIGGVNSGPGERVGTPIDGSAVESRMG